MLPYVALRITNHERCEKKRETQFCKHDGAGIFKDELDFYRPATVLESASIVSLQSFLGSKCSSIFIAESESAIKIRTNSSWIAGAWTGGNWNISQGEVAAVRMISTPFHTIGFTRGHGLAYR